MRWLSKAERQQCESIHHPTEKENNTFPQLCWPSKPGNSEPEKLICEGLAVPVNWVEVSRIITFWELVILQKRSKWNNSIPWVLLVKFQIACFLFFFFWYADKIGFFLLKKIINHCRRMNQSKSMFLFSFSVFPP